MRTLLIALVGGAVAAYLVMLAMERPPEEFMLIEDHESDPFPELELLH